MFITMDNMISMLGEDWVEMAVVQIVGNQKGSSQPDIFWNIWFIYWLQKITIEGVII